MRKQIGILFLFLFVLLTRTSIKAQTFDYTYNGTTLTYQIISVPDHEAVVVNAPSECVDVTVPSVIYKNGEAFKITEICGCKYGNGAFKDCKYLKSVVLPNTVYRIGNNAFQGCSWLRTVNLPSKLEWIEDYAFSGCESLTSISLPSSLRSIGKDAFKDTRLSSITLPASLRELGDNAFACQTLKTIKLSREIGFTMGKTVVFTNPYLEYATSYYNKPFPSRFSVWSKSDFKDHVLSSTSNVLNMMREAKISKVEQEKLIVPILLDSGQYETALYYFPNNKLALLQKKAAESYQYFAIGENYMEEEKFAEAKNYFEKALQSFPSESEIKEGGIDDDDTKEFVTFTTLRMQTRIADAVDSIAAQQVRMAEQERLRKEAEERAREEAEIARKKAMREAEEEQVRIVVDNKARQAKEDVGRGRLQIAIGYLQQAIDTATAHNYDYRMTELSRRIDSIRQVQAAVTDASRILDYRDFRPDLYEATDRALKLKIKSFLTDKDNQIERNNISFTFYTGTQPSTFLLEKSSRMLKKFCKGVLETEQLQPVIIDGRQVKSSATYKYDVEKVSGMVKVWLGDKKMKVNPKYDISPQLESDLKGVFRSKLGALPSSFNGNYKFKVTSMNVGGQMEHKVNLKDVQTQNGPQNAWRSLLVPGWGDKYVEEDGKFDGWKTALSYGFVGLGVMFLTTTIRYTTTESGWVCDSTWVDVSDDPFYVNQGITGWWATSNYRYETNEIKHENRYTGLGIICTIIGGAIWIGDVVHVWLKGTKNKQDVENHLGRLSFTYNPIYNTPELVYSLRF